MAALRHILVTGGCGFIGTNFILMAAKLLPGARVVCLDKLTYAGNLRNLHSIEGQEHFRFVRGDICDAKLVEGIFAQEGIDTVVHFAAESHVDRSIDGPAEFMRTNIMGTFTLLEAARKHWLGADRMKGARFLHVSTDEVYGSLGDTGLFTETTPYDPRSPYSASKASSDHLASAYHHTYGLPSLITNCSNNYGPYQFPEKLIALVTLNALEGKELPVYGDGKNVRDWLHVADHCRGIAACLTDGRVGERYNIGAGNERTNIEIVRMICDLLDELAEPLASNEPRRSLIRFVADRPGHDKRYALDASKIKGELAWEPSVDFAEGIRDTIRWYLDNPEWVKAARDGSRREDCVKEHPAV
jgi:dTDP-glucose 4,6-dehydratase